MNYKIKFFLFSFLMIAVATISFGQIDTVVLDNPVFPGGETDSVELLNIYNAIYSALVIVWGYVARLFKINVSANKYIFVVLAGGLVLGGAFYALGFSEVFPLVFSFLASIGVYDLFLKPAGLTNKPKKA